MYYICGMRKVIKSIEFGEFYDSSPQKVREKIDYAIFIVENFSVLNAKFVKKLHGTEFYELRISIGNEYRIMIFSIDNENIIEATQVYFLNGFLKKSTKDYTKQLLIAERILERTK